MRKENAVNGDDVFVYVCAHWIVFVLYDGQMSSIVLGKFIIWLIKLICVCVWNVYVYVYIWIYVGLYKIYF